MPVVYQSYDEMSDAALAGLLDCCLDELIFEARRKASDQRTTGLPRRLSMEFALWLRSNLRTQLQVESTLYGYDHHGRMQRRYESGEGSIKYQRARSAASAMYAIGCIKSDTELQLQACGWKIRLDCMEVARDSLKKCPARLTDDHDLLSYFRGRLIAISNIQAVENQRTLAEIALADPIDGHIVLRRCGFEGAQTLFAALEQINSDDTEHPSWHTFVTRSEGS